MLIWSPRSRFPAPPSSPIRKEPAKIQRRDNPLGYVGAGSLPHLAVLAAAPRSPLWAYQLLLRYPRSIRQSCFTTPATPSLPETCGGSPRVRGLIDVGGAYKVFIYLSISFSQIQMLFNGWAFVRHESVERGEISGLRSTGGWDVKREQRVFTVRGEQQ